jgi:hypothetical protein
MDGHLKKLTCPEPKCNKEFDEADVEKYGNEILVGKYKKFKESMDVDLNPNLKWCPRQNCGKYVEKGKEAKVKCACG